MKALIRYVKILCFVLMVAGLSGCLAEGILKSEELASSFDDGSNPDDGSLQPILPDNDADDGLTVLPQPSPTPYTRTYSPINPFVRNTYQTLQSEREAFMTSYLQTKADGMQSFVDYIIDEINMQGPGFCEPTTHRPSRELGSMTIINVIEISPYQAYEYDVDVTCEPIPPPGPAIVN